jgi:GNAT superfamily N-acetyltransferase
MKFVVGWDIEDFMDYRTRVVGTAGEIERKWVEKNSSHLIVWLVDNQIIGHAIWHESSTREHSPGDRRGLKDIEMLEELLDGPKRFVELHELWLREEYRGKGYGKKFFDFFENFMIKNNYKDVIFYAYNPAALSICRSRRYKEIKGFISSGINGKLEEMSIFYIGINVKKSI